ncbi:MULTISPECIES: hydrophobic protein [Streptomyces]|uniref:Hydrophobic protein n=1 Tax=Streptomyces cremeus TaxID=66881 RepID=A0ABV5PER3_STRCM
MVPLLLVLLLVLLLFGLGFVAKLFFWIAIAVLVLWLLGFVARSGSGGRRGRWYRW